MKYDVIVARLKKNLLYLLVPIMKVGVATAAEIIAAIEITAVAGVTAPARVGCPIVQNN